jgi:hypothetical protein
MHSGLSADEPSKTKTLVIVCKQRFCSKNTFKGDVMDSYLVKRIKAMGVTDFEVAAEMMARYLRTGILSVK